MSNSGQFKKGNTPWNKNKKNIHLHPDTEFRKNQYVGDNHPSWKGGEQINKNDCNYLWSGNSKRIRKPRKIYKDYYGSIPKSFIIIHIDGDNKNDNIENLEAISRKELLKRNRKK